jgi:outer membrane immunogenic protein
MIKKYLLSTIAVFGFVGVASAADLAVNAAPYVTPTYDWSGFYLGGFIGGGWSRNDISEPDLGIITGTLVNAPVVQRTTGSSFIGGIEGGDRYQIGKLVVGWEGDIAWGDTGGTSTTSFGPTLAPGVTFTRALNTSIKWTATATSTVGIAHNNWLLYGKAGAAWAHLDDTYNSTLTTPGVGTVPFFSGTGGQDRVGWTVGTGIEWGVWQNWSIKAEYDYIDFGTKTTPITGTVRPAGGAAVPLSAGLEDNLRIQQVKVGVNYRILSNLW